jgi:CAAX prenyl protease-like protein
LIWLGTQGYQDVALGGSHSQAGWLAFIAVSLGSIALARRWSLIAIDHDSTAVVGDRWPSAPYLLPFLVGIAALMLTRTVSSGFDWLYPLRVVVVSAALWGSRAHYRELRWDLSWQAVLIGAVAFAAWILLTSSPRSNPDTVDPWTGLAEFPRGGMVLWMVFRIVGAAIVVPLAEELAFRAYLTRRLIRQDYSLLTIGSFSWPSFLVSSSLFGLLHGSWLAGTVAGMLYAMAIYRRGQLADAALAHVTTNSCLAIYILTTGEWRLWN